MSLPSFRTGVLLPIILLILMTGVLLAIAVPAIVNTLQPPIHYDQAVYVPERPVLCAGETLAYTLTLEIDRPAVIFFSVSWHEAGTQRTVGPEDTLHVRNFTTPARFQRRRTYAVPALPPGDYELHAGSYEVRTSPALHDVPFTVADCAERPH